MLTESAIHEFALAQRPDFPSSTRREFCGDAHLQGVFGWRQQRVLIRRNARPEHHSRSKTDHERHPKKRNVYLERRIPSPTTTITGFSIDGVHWNGDSGIPAGILSFPGSIDTDTYFSTPTISEAGTHAR
jgi:hypothetical protein